MTFLDLIVAVVVLLGLWRGFQKGAIATAMSLFGWLIALIAGTRFADELAPFFADMTANPVLQIALGFLAICLGVVSLIHLAVYLSQKTLKALRLSFLDKLAGGVLGAGAGVLKVLVVLSLTAPLLGKLPSWEASVLTQNLLPLAPMAKTLVYTAADETWQEFNKDVNLPK